MDPQFSSSSFPQKLLSYLNIRNFRKSTIYAIFSLVGCIVLGSLCFYEIIQYFKRSLHSRLSQNFTLIVLLAHLLTFYWALLSYIYITQSDYFPRKYIILWIVYFNLTTNFFFFVFRISIEISLLNHRPEKIKTLQLRLKVLNDMHLHTEACLFSLKSFYLLKSIYDTVLVNHNGDVEQDGIPEINSEPVESSQEECGWNDVQFYTFMLKATNLNRKQVRMIYYMMDTRLKGRVYFDAFYTLACILVAIKDGLEKEFIHKHCPLIFKLVDQDGSGSISLDEFINFGQLFNFSDQHVKEIFVTYDESDNQGLELKELEMFALEALERGKSSLETKGSLGETNSISKDQTWNPMSKIPNILLSGCIFIRNWLSN